MTRPHSLFNVFLFIVTLFLSGASASAQQNFFNVPSSDVTVPGGVFFQQQLNFSRDALQSSTTICYGLGHRTEVGVNVLGLTFGYGHGFMEERHDHPYYPFGTVNLQKGLEVGHKYDVGIGAQIGSTRHGQRGGYVYANQVFHNDRTGTKLVGGVYYSSDSFFGDETRNVKVHGALSKVGLQAGMEQNLWRKRIFFQADYIGGKHAFGEVVVGGAGLLNDTWILSAGYQIPTLESRSVKALVVEATLVPRH